MRATYSPGSVCLGELVQAPVAEHSEEVEMQHWRYFVKDLRTTVDFVQLKRSEVLELDAAERSAESGLCSLPCLMTSNAK